MGHLYQACPKRKTRRECTETPTSQTWTDIIVNGQRPQKQTYIDLREDKKPRVNQRAPIMIPPSSIAEIKTTNDVHNPRTPAAGSQTSNQQDLSPPDSASDGMEQDPNPGWDEMATTPKEREDAKITNDLIQQAGRADPDPPAEEDSIGEPPWRHQAR
jgi:hypothetical protein